AVGDAAGPLEEQQATFGRRRHQAPAARLPDQRVVIDVRLVAEQGELEPILPARLAVAAAAVAAELGEDRDDLVAEVDGQVDVTALGGDGDVDTLVAKAGRNLGGAVADGEDPAGAGDAGHLDVAHLELDLAGQVLESAVGQFGGEDELLGVVEPLEGDP